MDKREKPTLFLRDPLYRHAGWRVLVGPGRLWKLCGWVEGTASWPAQRESHTMSQNSCQRLPGRGMGSGHSVVMVAPAT